MKSFLALFLILATVLVATPETTHAQWNAATGKCKIGGLTVNNTLIPGTGKEFALISADNPANVKPCLEGANNTRLNPMSSAVCLVQAVLSQSMFAVYCDILNGMLPMFNVMMTLYLLFYVFCYIFGIADVNGKDFIIRLIKVLAIYAFATNPDVFMRYFYQPWFAVIDGIAEEVSALYVYAISNPAEAQQYLTRSTQLQSIWGSTSAGGSGHLPFFYRLDYLFEQLVGREAAPGLILLAILFLFSGAGFWVGLLIMCGALSMIIAIVMVVATYTTAMMALTFLLMFTPLFFALALFSTTRKLFEGWLASLISYTMQPILLFIMILILSSALNVGQDGLMSLLVPVDIEGCKTALEARDDACNYTPPDVITCGSTEYAVAESCKPAIVASKTETKFNLGMATAVIENIPKIIDGKYGSLATTTDPANPFGLVFTPQAGYDPNNKDNALSGDSGENASLFNFAKDKAIPNILAFLIIGAMVSQFMTFVPRLSQYLAVWKGHRSAPVISSGMGLAGRSNLFGAGNSGGSGVFGVGNWVTMGAGRALSSMASYKGDPKVAAAGLGAAALAARELFAKRDSSSNLSKIAQGFVNRPGEEQNHLWFRSIAALTGNAIYSGSTKRGGESNQSNIAIGETNRDNPYGFNFSGKYGYAMRPANPEQSAQYAMRIHGKKTVRRQPFNIWKFLGIK